MKYFLNDPLKNKCSHDLEKYYRLNGVLYIGDCKKREDNPIV